MIGPPTWVYSATVGDSTAGASIFPRRRDRARRGALRQEFRADAYVYNFMGVPGGVLNQYLNLGGTWYACKGAE
jgi:hypothetical protein